MSEGYRHFGLLFWQMAISGLVLSLVARATGLRPRWDRGALRLYLLIALIGTILPGSASYQAAVHLPAGLMAILVSTVPIFAFPIALALGAERLTARRALGLGLGLAGVALTALPGTGGAAGGLAGADAALWVGVALVAPVFYGIEGNVVSRLPATAPGAIEMLLGASLVGAPLAAVMALATGQWIDPRPPWGAPDLAVVVSASVHGLVYAAYVRLVGLAGAVFAGQVAYLVTGFGVIWSMLLLSERYPLGIWLAFAVIFAGMALVQPRLRTPSLVPAGTGAKV